MAPAAAACKAPTEERLREVFDRLDTDGSDELDYTELKQALSRYGGPVDMSLGELKKVWMAADKDGSDQLDFGEFCSAVGHLPPTFLDGLEEQARGRVQAIHAKLGAPVTAAGASSSAAQEITAEAKEVSELVAMISQGSSSKRPPLNARRREGSAGGMGSTRSAGGKKLLGDIGPGWNSTPHRNRPKALRGLNSTTEEPWKRSEELNFGRDAHIEWVAQHRNLYRSGVEPVAALSVPQIEQTSKKKSEEMGNRLLTRQARQEAARQRTAAAAAKAAQRAEEEARAAELERVRHAWEMGLVQQAKAEDAALVEALREQRRREAEARAEAEAREAAQRVEEEVERQRLAAQAEAEAAAASKARADKEMERAPPKKAGGKLTPKKGGGVQFDAKAGGGQLTPTSAAAKKKAKEAFMHRSVASKRLSQKSGGKAK